MAGLNLERLGTMTSEMLVRFQRLAESYGNGEGFKIEQESRGGYYKISIGDSVYCFHYNGLSDESLTDAYFILGSELRYKEKLRNYALEKQIQRNTD